MENARRDLAELERLVEEQRAILNELEEELQRRHQAIRHLGRQDPTPDGVATRTARIARGRIRRAARSGRAGQSAVWIAPPAGGTTDSAVADLMDARSLQWRRTEDLGDALRDGRIEYARRLLDEIIDTEIGMQVAAGTMPVKGPWIGLAEDLLAADDDVIRAARALRNEIDDGGSDRRAVGAILTGQTQWLRSWRVLAQILPPE